MRVRTVLANAAAPPLGYIHVPRQTVVLDKRVLQGVVAQIYSVRTPFATITNTASSTVLIKVRPSQHTHWAGRISTLFDSTDECAKVHNATGFDNSAGCDSGCDTLLYVERDGRALACLLIFYLRCGARPMFFTIGEKEAIEYLVTRTPVNGDLNRACPER